MSDIETPTTPPPAEPAAPPPAASAEPDYKALWEQEKSERIRERNLYKPVQQMLRDLDDDAVSAISNLTELARRGDTEGIIDWSLSTAQNVSGSDLAALIARRQGTQVQTPMIPQQQAPATPAPVLQQQGIPNAETQRALDVETARQIAREEAAEFAKVQAAISQVTAVLDQAGYPVDSPAGQTIIHWANVNGKSPQEAIAWYNADLDARAAARTAALAAAANGTPQPAPTGAPAGSSPVANMTPSQRALERLRSGNNA